METSATATALDMQALDNLYQSVYGAYAQGGLNAVLRDYPLVLAMAVLALILLLLFAIVVFMPTKRKVVVRRRVRVTRTAVAPVPTAAAAAVEAAEPPSDVRPSSTSKRRRLRPWVVTAVWGAIVVAAFAATYVVTGSNAYCGQSCHVEDAHVVLAVEHEHAECIACHEAGVVSGGAARLRMAVSYLVSEEATSLPVPVDPSQCLGCHGEITSMVSESASGLRVAHKQILESGRACIDCHRDVGHNSARSFAGGMSSCTVCHDGTTASSECRTCHANGSPLEVVRTVSSSTASFSYFPVQVASRDCSRCHDVEERCVGCHNGFVLPHPAAFRAGGHARTAAFSAKERCFKCHTIAWCGSGRCHNAFSPHDPQRWPADHQSGTSATCGGCHVAWDGQGNWCDACH